MSQTSSSTALFWRLREITIEMSIHIIKAEALLIGHPLIMFYYFFLLEIIPNTTNNAVPIYPNNCKRNNSSL